MHQKMTCKGHIGGLLILIHDNYAFPDNISKVSTMATISPFL